MLAILGAASETQLAKNQRVPSTLPLLRLLSSDDFVSSAFSRLESGFTDKGGTARVFDGCAIPKVNIGQSTRVASRLGADHDLPTL